jgi:AraC-like DNA-binding protein
MANVVGTTGLPARQRLDYWRHLVSDTFAPLQVDRAPAGSAEGQFRGQLRSALLGRLRVSEVRSTAQVVRRTPKLIARSDADFYKFGLHVQGACVLAQDGRETPLAPGDLAIWDTTRPYSLAFSNPFRQLVVVLPRRQLGIPPDRIARITANPISGKRGMGALLSPFLFQLAERLDEFGTGGGDRLAQNIEDLLGTLLAEQLDTVAPCPEAGRRALLLRAKSCIERRLGDPDLSADSVAAANFISTRYLQKLFQEEGATVSGWIRSRRLEKCWRALRDPHEANRSVSAIAAHWGFIDAAHFSRIFRATYGMSPRDCRAGHLPDAHYGV